MPACLQYIRHDFNLVRTAQEAKTGGGGDLKRVTRLHQTRPRALQRPSGGHCGSGPPRRESANPKPYIAESACDQTIWDASCSDGPVIRRFATPMLGRACDRTFRDADVRMNKHPSEGPLGSRKPAIAEPAMLGQPGPLVKPPARRRGKSRDSRMLDWDTPARLTPLPDRRHVSRAPTPSPAAKARHSAAGGIIQPTHRHGWIALFSAPAAPSYDTSQCDMTPGAASSDLHRHSQRRSRPTQRRGPRRQHLRPPEPNAPHHAGREQNDTVPVPPEAGPPPQPHMPPVPHRRRDPLGPPPIAGRHLIRAHSQPAEHAWVTQVGQIRNPLRRHLHSHQRQSPSRPHQMGLAQRPVPPRLNGLGDRVFR